MMTISKNIKNIQNQKELGENPPPTPLEVFFLLDVVPN